MNKVRAAVQRRERRETSSFLSLMRMICPKCKNSKKAISKSGRVLGYCRECLNSYHRKNMRRIYKPSKREKKLNLEEIRAVSEQTKSFPCPRCKIEGRVVWNSGNRDAYCRGCRMEISREWKAKNQPTKQRREPVQDVHLCLSCRERDRFRSRDGKLSKFCWECSRKKRLEIAS